MSAGGERSKADLYAENDELRRNLAQVIDDSNRLLAALKEARAFIGEDVRQKAVRDSALLTRVDYAIWKVEGKKA